jgi:hypothetical protein
LSVDTRRSVHAVHAVHFRKPKGGAGVRSSASTCSSTALAGASGIDRSCVVPAWPLPDRRDSRKPAPSSCLRYFQNCVWARGSSPNSSQATLYDLSTSPVVA